MFDFEHVKALAEMARCDGKPESYWGCSEQVAALNSLSEIVERHTSPETFERFYDWCLKASNDEIVQRALDELEPRVITDKWVRRMGWGFHPDTKGVYYSPELSAAEVSEYDADMERLFDIATDPYEHGVASMEAFERGELELDPGR